MTLRTTKEIYSDTDEMGKLGSFGFEFDDGFIQGKPSVDWDDLYILTTQFGKLQISQDEVVILNYV